MSSWRELAITAAVLTLSLAGGSVGQAKQRSEEMPIAGIVAKIRKPPRFFYNYQPTPSFPGCTWPYRNMAPPCWSTWPAGDPNFHGTNGL
jgi:hypothetical protein